MLHPRALNMLRAEVHYRREKVDEGLTNAGFVVVQELKEPKPTDVLVIWNRMGNGLQTARRFDQAGAAVLVMENGFVGHSRNPSNKPMDLEGSQLYALALDHHNGVGRWQAGPTNRRFQQGIRTKPWRVGGEHILVLGQRGIGEPGVAAPRNWSGSAACRLAKLTQRPIKIRPHPGREPEKSRPLEFDLENCWAVATWSSNAALQALCLGYPILCDFPKWIGRRAGVELEWADNPLTCNIAREYVLKDVSWAQFSIEEIGQGWPFKRLLMYRDRLDKKEQAA